MHIERCVICNSAFLATNKTRKTCSDECIRAAKIKAGKTRTIPEDIRKNRHNELLMILKILKKEKNINNPSAYIAKVLSVSARTVEAWIYIEKRAISEYKLRKLKDLLCLN